MGGVVVSDIDAFDVCIPVCNGCVILVCEEHPETLSLVHQGFDAIARGVLTSLKSTNLNP